MKTVVIYEFMIKELKLKGLELLFFALVYSFAQFDSQLFAKVETICEFLDCSRSQFYEVRKSLINKKLISLIEGSYIIKCDAYYSYFGQHLSVESNEKLNELVRIAKTNWLDD